MPISRIVIAALLGLMLVPAVASAHAILVASTPAAGASVAAGRVDMTFRYNSRIDRARSRLTLTDPDHRLSVLKIMPTGQADTLQTSTSSRARRLCRALAGAGDRRSHHARRRAVHRDGALTHGPADRSVRLPVDRHSRSDDRRAVGRAGQRAVPCMPAAAPDHDAARLGRAGRRGSCLALAAWSALALVLCEAATVSIAVAVLVRYGRSTFGDTMRADFAIAGTVKNIAAALLAVTLFALGQRAPVTPCWRCPRSCWRPRH